MDTPKTCWLSPSLISTLMDEQLQFGSTKRKIRQTVSRPNKLAYVDLLRSSHHFSVQIIRKVRKVLFLHASTLFENYSKCRIWILAFSANFCPIKTDQSGSTVWPQASDFQKLAQMENFWHFFTFVHSKCKHRSLRSQYCVRLLLHLKKESIWESLYKMYFKGFCGS